MNASSVTAVGLSDPFLILSSTSQGCVLAPLLFDLHYTAMFLVAFHNNNVGVDIYYLTVTVIGYWRRRADVKGVTLLPCSGVLVVTEKMRTSE